MESGVLELAELKSNIQQSGKVVVQSQGFGVEEGKIKFQAEYETRGAISIKFCTR